jgi:hypothetical protein
MKKRSEEDILEVYIGFGWTRRYVASWIARNSKLIKGLMEFG